jgi:hypothetical protein
MPCETDAPRTSMYKAPIRSAEGKLTTKLGRQHFLYYTWPLAGNFPNEGPPPHEIDRLCSLD